MTLRAYLRRARKTYREFGQQIDATEHAVAHWARGRRIPRREMMTRIHDVTDGAVTPADFYAAEAARKAA